MKKRVVKEWLRYMVTIPLYERNKIQYNKRDFNNLDDEQQPSISTASDNGNNDYALEMIETDNDKKLLFSQEHTVELY